MRTFRPHLLTVVVPVLAVFMGEGSISQRISHNWWIAIILLLVLGGSFARVQAGPKRLVISRAASIVLGCMAVLSYAAVAYLLVRPLGMWDTLNGNALTFALQVGGLMIGMILLVFAVNRVEWF